MLVLVRVHRAIGGMKAFGIVKVEVFFHRPRELLSSLVTLTANGFDLKGSEKAFHDGVIPAVTASTHAGLNTQGGESLLESMAGVLASLIGVKQ